MVEKRATQAREIYIQSAAKPDSQPIWSASVALGLRNANTPNDADPLRNPALRLLAQELDTRELAYRDSKGKLTVSRHHSALLLEAAVRPFEQGIDLVKPAVSRMMLDGGSEGQIAATIGKVAESRPYDLVTLAALERITKKDTVHIVVPPCALSSGSISILLPGYYKEDKKTIYNPLCAKLGIPSKKELWARPSIAIFGINSGMTVAFVKKGGENHVPITLVPDGIEVDVAVASPFAEEAKLFTLRLRIIFEPVPGGGNYLAWPVGDGPNATKPTGISAFRTDFDDAMERFSWDNRPLALSWRREDCAVGWYLGKSGDTFAVGVESKLAFRNGTLAAILISDREPGSALPTAAEIELRQAAIAREANALVLKVNEKPAKVDIAVVWLPDSPDSASDVQLPAKLDAIAETAEFGSRMRARYEAAHILPDDPMLPLYGFFPLERGFLQVPLPVANPEAPIGVQKPPSAIEGSVRVTIPLNPDSPLAPRLELGATNAIHIEAKREWTALRPTVTAVFAGPRGVASGFLFAAGSSPRDGEMLPDLSAGPIAAEPMDLVIGEAKIGYTAAIDIQKVRDPEKNKDVVDTILVTLKGWSEWSAMPEIPILAWLAHPSMALVSSFPMTRTRPVPGRPSETRDLVLFQHDSTSDKQNWKMPLTLRMLVGAKAQTAFPQLAGFMSVTVKSPIWPWPKKEDVGNTASEDSEIAAGVSLSALTLPGVEFFGGLKPDFSDMKGSLRFDLPIHGELFASVTLPQPNAPDKKMDEPPEEPSATALRPELIGKVWARAADRIALSRTMNDRLSGWSDFHQILPKPAPEIDVAGLVEPQTWKTTFALALKLRAKELPLGAYVLDNKSYSAGAALAGWSGTALGADITGFSARHREGKIDATDAQTDTRGIALQKIPDHGSGVSTVEWRKLSYQNGNKKTVSRIAVTAPILRFGFGTATWAVRTRDLPCAEAGGKIQFSAFADPKPGKTTGTLVGVEGFVGPRGKVFKRDELPLANYEWSLFEEGTGAFTLPLGPFRFRPLRLVELALSSLDANASLTDLKVIGNLEPPARLPTTGEPFVEDEPYATGNPIVIHFSIAAAGNDPPRAAIKAIGSATIDSSNRISIDLGKPAEVEFRANAKAVYNGREAAESSDLPITLRLKIDVPDDPSLNEVKVEGALDATLFGTPFGPSEPSLLIPAHQLDDSLVLLVKPSGLDTSPLDLSFSDAVLDWPSDDDPEINLFANIVLSPDPASNEAPRRAIVSWELGKTLAWFGMTSDNPTFTIDHRRGALTLTCKDEVAQGTFLSDFPAASTLDVAFAVALHLEQHIIKAKAGFFEARLQGGQTLSERVDIRHTMKLQGGEAAWQSRLLVSLPFRKRVSEIRWPLNSIASATLDAYEPRPDEPSGEGWMRYIDVGPANAPVEHSMIVFVIDAPLDIGLIGVTKGIFTLAKPWCLRAKTHHQLTAPAGGHSLSWTGIDEIVILDARHLVAETDGVIGAKGLKDEAYAFAARYQETVKLKTDPAYVPTAGVLNRALARAGLPSFDMLAAIASEVEAAKKQVPPRQPDLPVGLLMLGASTIEVGDIAATGKTRAGHVVVTPWFTPLEAGSAGILSDIRQASSKPLRQLVSTFDLTPQLVRRLPDKAPYRIAARDRSVTVLGLTLEALARADMGDGSSIVPFTPVSQAISQSFEDIEDIAIWKQRPADDWKQRPIWLRSIIAWRAIFAWPQLADQFQDHIAILLPVATDGRALRVASTLDDVATAILEGKGSGKVLDDDETRRYDALILAKDAVHTMALRSSEINWAKDADAGQRRRIARLSLSLASDPLAIAIGAVTDSLSGDDADYPGPTRDIVAFLDLPSATSEPEDAIPLRRQSRSIFGSSASAWPSQSGRLGEGPTSPAFGNQRPLQDPTFAWAGEARNFTVPARAFAADSTFATASVLTIGQRSLFRRPASEAGIGPPDRALIPIPARARLPLPQRVKTALAPQRLRKVAEEGKTPDLEECIALVQPGHFEVVTTGRRPGALFFHYDGLLFADDKAAAFDAIAPRFGRPADRGPVIWRQMRAPRSTIFAEESSLLRRRQTFIEDYAGTTGDAPLKKFVVSAGPMAVLRFAPDPDEADPSVLRAVLLRPKPIEAAYALDGKWSGVLDLTVTPLGELKRLLADILARLGILQGGEDGLRATLLVGSDPFVFSELAYDESAPFVLTLHLSGESLHAAQAALAAASADTRAELVLECGRGDKKPGSPTTLATARREKLQGGPLRILSMPIPIASMTRACLPLQLATLAFGDPAYDRELASKTASTRLQDGDVTVTLALDRLEYDLRATLHLAFGRIAQEENADVDWAPPQEQKNGQLAFFLVRESDPDKAEPLELASVTPTTDGGYEVEGGQPYAVQLSDLRRKVVSIGPSSDTAAELKPGDRLQVAVTFGTKSVSVYATIAAEPVIAPPASVYGLATLDGTDVNQRLTASLFASAPLPQLLDYPALRQDLARGMVRRYGLFLWPFMPRVRLVPGQPFASLIKLDRTGGGQLPSSATDFTAIES